jgi:O-methyltransferase
MHAMTRKKLANVLWPRFSSSVEALNRNAAMFASLRSYRNDTVGIHAKRDDLYAAVNARLGNIPISYLEFGVWKGESIRSWARISAHPESRFYGFDSFEGLPEEWDHGFGHATSKERFDLGGAAPRIADGRVTLIKGWFQCTLRPFLRNSKLQHPLVIHIDCDLHSSALYTLSTLDPIVMRGDVIVFDEYTSPANEYLAWEEYKHAFMREAICIGMSDRWCQAAFLLS